MSDHLPECPLATACKHDHYDEPPVQCANCGEECLCPALRACEQRVWDEAYACGFNAGRAHGETVGRTAGLRDAVNSDAVRGAIRLAEQRTLDAAREAVERVSTLFEPLGPALAAIDALRGEQ